MAYQIADDVLDYSGGEAAFGKNVGTDLKEGKTTLPLHLRDACVGSPAQQTQHCDSARRTAVAWKNLPEVMESDRINGSATIRRQARRGKLRWARCGGIGCLCPIRTAFATYWTSLASFRGAARTISLQAFHRPVGRGVAQPGRALSSGGRSRWFKSSHPDQLAFFCCRAYSLRMDVTIVDKPMK